MRLRLIGSEKKNIFKESLLFAVCPSQWLADKVKHSMLMPALARLEVIPNGVDANVFKPGDKAAARAHLGWPQDGFIVIFSDNVANQSIWKDYSTLREAFQMFAYDNNKAKVRFYGIGGNASPDRFGSAYIEFIPYRNSMLECLQAADVFVQMAKVEVCSLVIAEAMACGCPVVATAVGGIPEQINDGKTGFLIPPGNAVALAKRLEELVRNPHLRLKMGEAAAVHARSLFSLEKMTKRYIQVYETAKNEFADAVKNRRM